MMSNKTLLIADDDRDFVHSLSVRCRRLGFEVGTAYSAREAQQIIENQPPMIACLDVEMPPGNGLAVAENIKRNPRLAKIPVIILTGNRDTATVTRCLQLGAHYLAKGADIASRLEPLLIGLADKVSQSQSTVVLEKGNVARSTYTANNHRTFQPLSRISKSQLPTDDSLMDAVFAALAVNPSLLQSEPHCSETTTTDPSDAHDVPWILMIDDDPDFTWALKKRLEQHGVAVVRAFDGTEGYRTAFSHTADLITLDFEMPNGRGDYVLRRLKDNPVTRGIPVIVLTGRQDRMLERTMLNLGATRVMTKPYDFEELLAELRKHLPLVTPHQAETLVNL